jgi:TPR repeat protein
MLVVQPIAYPLLFSALLLLAPAPAYPQDLFTDVMVKLCNDQLAKKGEASGSCYRGDVPGFPRNARKYAAFIIESANDGSIASMSEASYLYRDGNGVKKSLVKAHMWANLAHTYWSQRKSTTLDAPQPLFILEREMTPEEIAEAEDMALAYKPKHKLR